jgi:hypothetical protein
VRGKAWRRSTRIPAAHRAARSPASAFDAPKEINSTSYVPRYPVGEPLGWSVTGLDAVPGDLHGCLLRGWSTALFGQRELNGAGPQREDECECECQHDRSDCERDGDPLGETVIGGRVDGDEDAEAEGAGELLGDIDDARVVAALSPATPAMPAAVTGARVGPPPFRDSASEPNPTTNARSRQRSTSVYLLLVVDFLRSLLDLHEQLVEDVERKFAAPQKAPRPANAKGKRT